MKKLLTLIAITSGFIPALHSMDSSLPTDVQKKYDNLTTLIQNADVNAFKPAFDELSLPTENIAALRQIITETKATLTNELDAMGDKTKSWSKIVKGSLATAGGLWAGISIPVALHLINDIDRNGTAPVIIGSLPIIIPNLLIGFSIKTIFKPKDDHIKFIRNIILIPNILTCLGAAYKGITYGPKTFKAGLNYKEHLQNMLANLDAIDAHITQAKVQN